MIWLGFLEAIKMMETAKREALEQEIEWTALEEAVLTILYYLHKGDVK